MVNKLRPSLRHRVSGFALPTILVASVVMIIILVSAVSSFSSIRTSIQDQHYDKLASIAAESGLTRAKDCLQANNYIASWTTASPLRPNTSCTGGIACDTGVNCFVLSQGNVRTTFRVDASSYDVTSQTIIATGTVEVLRSATSEVWRTYEQSLVARVGADVGFDNITFGYTNSAGAFFITIAADGALRGTGGNLNGQLGNGTVISRTEPTTYAIPAGYHPIDVYAGFLSQGENTFVNTDEGTLFASGANYAGQLGDGTTNNRLSPVEVQLPYTVQALSVTPNGKSTFILGNDNKVYAMGLCTDGQLGTNYTITGCTDQTTPKPIALPTYTSTDPNTQPTAQIVADANTAYVVMKGGRVYGWGKNAFGQLATGDTQNSSVPVKIGTWGDAGKPKAVSIAFDGDDLVVVGSDGLVKTVGRNRFGMLGDGSTTQRNTLVDFQLPLSAGRAVKASADHSSLTVMTETGQVWSAGLNDSGQLGDGSTINRSTPVRFILPAGVLAKDIYNTSGGPGATFSNIFVVGSNGRVYGAGSNIYGQLGDGTTTNRSTPVVMQVINGTTIQAKLVQAGYGTAVILTTDNKIYTVGHNNQGQLGDGTTTNSSIPSANRYTNIVPPTLY